MVRGLVNRHRKLDEWGTAVNVQSMVWNMGETRLPEAFTRNPGTGESVLWRISD